MFFSVYSVVKIPFKSSPEQFLRTLLRLLSWGVVNFVGLPSSANATQKISVPSVPSVVKNLCRVCLESHIRDTHHCPKLCFLRLSGAKGWLPGVPRQSPPGSKISISRRLIADEAACLQPGAHRLRRVQAFDFDFRVQRLQGYIVQGAEDGV